jgi:hypothetical protein
MQRTLALLDGGSQALSYYLGALVLGLAAAVIFDLRQPSEIIAWATRVLGFTFLALLSALILATLYGWVRLTRPSLPLAQRQLWQETGMHAANGIATLGLTYTLFGISLGIGELAGQELTPATVQEVIRGLTERFSLAFMTTVISLPTSVLLRALLSISGAWMVAQDKQSEGMGA